METVTLDQLKVAHAATAALINGHAAQLQMPPEVSREGPQANWSELIETLQNTNNLARLALALAS